MKPVKKALLLCAGYGSRLRPLTNVVPKSLVPVHGVPLLACWIDSLFHAGVDEVLINTHHLREELTAFIRMVSWPVSITLSHEPRLLGTAGTLRTNAGFFGREDFYLVHADNYSLYPEHRFLESHFCRPEQSVMTMMTFYSSCPQSCGVVMLNSSGDLVEAFYEKSASPPSNLASGAVFLCTPRVLDVVLSQPGTPEDFSAEIVPLLAGQFGTFLNRWVHQDIGSWDGLKKGLLSVRRAFRHPGLEKSATNAWEKLFKPRLAEIKEAVGPDTGLRVYWDQTSDPGHAGRITGENLTPFNLTRGCVL